MGLIVRLLRKDLTRRLRAPVALVVMIVFPLVLTAILGLAFGPAASGEGGLPRVKILVVDLDEGLLSRFVGGAGQNPEMSERFELVQVPDLEEGRRRMEAGVASAMLVIPEGFTADLLDEKPVTLPVVKNPAESILPQVVEEMARVLAVYLDNGVRLLADPLQELRDTFEGVAGDASSFPENAVLASLTVQIADKLRGIADYVFPPVVVSASVDEDEVPLRALLDAEAGEDLEAVKARLKTTGVGASEGADTGGGFNLFAALLPMVSVLAILFIAENGMQDLLVEQREGTLTRLLISPAGTARVLVSKVLLSVALCVGAIVVLAIVGLAMGWVPTSVEPVAALAHTLALSIAAAGFALLIYGFVRTERAATACYTALLMGMAMLGGSFVPVDQLPAFLRRLSPFTINYWGIQGYWDLTVRDGGMSEVAPRILVLVSIGVVLGVVGWLALSRRASAGRMR